MPRSRHSAATARRTAELAFAAPQVIAHRLQRMAVAGPTLSGRDRKEFTGMVVEKQVAFTQACMAAWQQWARAQQSFTLAAWRAFFSGTLPGLMSTSSLAGRSLATSAAMANAALVPVHRKAVSNARRLGRTRLGR
ncbi:polyhydroxyalkanoate granule-associated phasin [Ramlibacter sp. MMS24-I3-19]|uniref:polyhydroxyalkanoate granule-associated phasin n=1 Tax=Ramlibacter sp. MMS24-I3-19 TaxID=3416606 RepID=UPI003CFD8C9C